MTSISADYYTLSSPPSTSSLAFSYCFGFPLQTCSYTMWYSALHAPINKIYPFTHYIASCWLSCSFCPQLTVGMVRMVSPSCTMVTPSPPRSFSEMSSRPSTSMPSSRMSTFKHTHPVWIFLVFIYSLWECFGNTSVAHYHVWSSCHLRQLTNCEKCVFGFNKHLKKTSRVIWGCECCQYILVLNITAC